MVVSDRALQLYSSQEALSGNERSEVNFVGAAGFRHYGNLSRLHLDLFIHTCRKNLCNKERVLISYHSSSPGSYSLVVMCP